MESVLDPRILLVVTYIHHLYEAVLKDPRQRGLAKMVHILGSEARLLTLDHESMACVSQVLRFSISPNSACIEGF